MITIKEKMIDKDNLEFEIETLETREEFDCFINACGANVCGINGICLDCGALASGITAGACGYANELM